tara:strand:+ start:291 stop:434 length:144 start_codon:yes stop_codon:yes gene_type:complete
MKYIEYIYLFIVDVTSITMDHERMGVFESEVEVSDLVELLLYIQDAE